MNVFHLGLFSLFAASSGIASAADRHGELQAPESYQGLETSERSPDPWWSRFDDEELDTLVELAMEHNASIEAFQHNLRQAEALSRNTLSPLLPMLSVEVSQMRQPCLETGFALCDIVAYQTGGQAPDTYTQGSTMLTANMGVDLWGEQLLTVRSTRAELGALTEEQESLESLVMGQVVDALIGLRHALAIRNLLQDQIDTTRRLLAITESRYQRTEATTLDVLQQREQLTAQQAQLPLLDLQIELATSRLRVLCGGEALPELRTDVSLPEFDLPMGLGSPADLIETRPEVQAALLRYEAALSRERAAVRAALPDLGLTAQTGSNRNDIIEAETENNWAIGASLSIPLFSGGAVLWSTQAARAETDALFSTAQQTLWDAIAEVEGAALREHALRIQIRRLEEQVSVAELAFTEATRLYEAGLGTTIQVLTSQVQFFSAQTTLLNARLEHLSSRTQIWTALGPVEGTLP